MAKTNAIKYVINYVINFHTFQWKGNIFKNAENNVTANITFVDFKKGSIVDTTYICLCGLGS